MMNDYYKKNTSLLTPYLGNARGLGKIPSIVINRVNYELTRKICNKCIHSMYYHDSLPPICKIGICNLQYEESELDRINSINCLKNNIEDRFLFIVKKTINNEQLSIEEIKELLSDNRMLILRNCKLCYPVIKNNCLYRVKDIIVFMFLNSKESAQYENIKIKDRDKWIEDNIKERIEMNISY